MSNFMSGTEFDMSGHFKVLTCDATTVYSQGSLGSYYAFLGSIAADFAGSPLRTAFEKAEYPWMRLWEWCRYARYKKVVLKFEGTVAVSAPITMSLVIQIHGLIRSKQQRMHLTPRQLQRICVDFC